jgi:hypothetical protein
MLQSRHTDSKTTRGASQMFGQQDDKPQDENQIPDHSINGVIDDQAQKDNSNDDQNWQHPGAPLSAGTEADAPSAGEKIIAPTTPMPNHDSSSGAALPVSPTLGRSSDDTHHDLIDIKQKALSQLSPLVDHLDQSPEEKFRTMMMMIQASDDEKMIQSAYEAAQKIEDEKTRAQALLDIVNEINYFTQHSES